MMNYLLKIVIDKLKVTVPLSSVRRLRRECGWVITSTKYTQIVSGKNRVKRLEWCREQLKSGDTFDDVIWIDESRVQLDPNGTLTFHKIGEPKRRKPKPKHPLSVLVWCGISKNGPTSLAVFEGIMDAGFYTEQIIKARFKPLQEEYFPYSHR